MKIAVIPARGGSKRIPRKNIRPFAGKPIIAYSIEAALESALFDRVIVSTDDAEIAEVAVAYGAETPFVRPAALADDRSGTSAVVKHAIAWAREDGCDVTHACCIYATAPFIRAHKLQEALDRLLSSGKSFALGVATYAFPIQRAIRVTPSDAVEPVFPEYATVRSQDLEPTYHDAGQFCWGTAEAFLRDLAVLSPATVPVILPPYLVQDIDTPGDWHRAELLYQAWALGQAGQSV